MKRLVNVCMLQDHLYAEFSYFFYKYSKCPIWFLRSALWGQSLLISLSLIGKGCDIFAEVVSLVLCRFGLAVLLWVGCWLFGCFCCLFWLVLVCVCVCVCLFLFGGGVWVFSCCGGGGLLFFLMETEEELEHRNITCCYKQSF